MSIMKSGEEVMSAALDAVVRGDFSTAYNKYSEAARKFSKQNDSYGYAISSGYMSILAIALSPDNPGVYYSAAQVLRSLGNVPLKIGLHETTSSQLADEAELLAAEKEILAVVPSNPMEHGARAKRLQDIAMGYRSKTSGRVLIIPEIFWKETTPGEARALPLLAMAEESLGQSLVQENPKAAAEHFQTARLWWMQAGRADMAQTASNYVQSYGLAVKCWFCGREVSGENVHFVSIPSDLTDMLKKAASGTALPSFNEANGMVYACKGCYGAIFALSESIATQKTQELEVKINKQLEDIKRQLGRMGPRL